MTDNAAVKALEEKVEALQRKVGSPLKVVAAPKEPTLAECNARAALAAAELAAEKADAATMAKKAIDEAFRGGPRARVMQSRMQKNLSPVAAEMAAASKVSK